MRRYLHFARASRHEFLQTKKASPVIASPRENKGAVWLGGLFFSSPVRVLVRRNKYILYTSSYFCWLKWGFSIFSACSSISPPPPPVGKRGKFGASPHSSNCMSSLPFLSFLCNGFYCHFLCPPPPPDKFLLKRSTEEEGEKGKEV